MSLKPVAGGHICVFAWVGHYVMVASAFFDYLKSEIT